MAWRSAFLAFSVIWFATVWSAAVQAQEASYVLDIPAAKADVSLKALAKATGKSLLFDYREVQDTDTNSLHGTYTLKEALAVLLANTGLASKITRGEVITIEPVPQSTAKTDDAGSERPGKAAAAARSRRARAADDDKSGAFVIEEILVSARKVRENLQNTPVSVSAFTGEKLETRQVFDTQDLDHGKTDRVGPQRRAGAEHPPGSVPGRGNLLEVPPAKAGAAVKGEKHHDAVP